MTVPTYANFGEAIHGAYVMGDTVGNKLRTLWNNIRALAADDTTGYGKEGYDMGSTKNFPCGYAYAVYRSTCTPRSYRTHTPSGADYSDGTIKQRRIVFYDQRMYVFHTKPFLYYRTKGSSLFYTGRDLEESSVRLEDFNDITDNDHAETNHYHVLDLRGVDGLEIGTYYEIRCQAETATEETTDPNFTPNLIDFAFERYS